MKKGRKKGVEANEKSPKTLINKGDVKIYEIRNCNYHMIINNNKFAMNIFINIIVASHFFAAAIKLTKEFLFSGARHP